MELSLHIVTHKIRIKVVNNKITVANKRLMGVVNNNLMVVNNNNLMEDKEEATDKGNKWEVDTNSITRNKEEVINNKDIRNKIMEEDMVTLMVSSNNPHMEANKGI